MSRRWTLAIAMLCAAAGYAVAGGYRPCAELAGDERTSCIRAAAPESAPGRRDLAAVSELVADRPELVIEIIDVLAARSGDDSSVSLQASLLDLRGRALLALDQPEEAEKALSAAVDLDDGTTRLTWVGDGTNAKGVAVGVGNGRLVRLAEARIAAGRPKAARPILARAVELGAGEEVRQTWRSIGGRELKGFDRTPTTISTIPWRRPLPEFEIGLLEGGVLTEADVRGQVLVLDFWASWCEPCRKELPHLDELYAQEAENGLRMVAVNVSETLHIALAFADELGLRMPIGFPDPELDKIFGVDALPTVFVVGKNGRIHQRWTSYAEGQELEIAGLVRRLLAADVTPADATPLATVHRGGEQLAMRWSRKALRDVEGILALEGAGVLAAQDRSIALFDAAGDVIDRFAVPVASGKMSSGPVQADGSRAILGFRPGSTRLMTAHLPGKSLEVWEAPSPVFDACWESSERLVLATLDGLWSVDPEGGDPRRIADLGTVSSVECHEDVPRSGLIALQAGRAISRISTDGTVSDPQEVDQGAWSLLSAAQGLATVPSAVQGTAVGRFQEGRDSQIALALTSGQLVVLDSDGVTEVFRADWPGLREIGAQDLDGDGVQELLVGSTNRLTVLSSVHVDDDSIVQREQD